MFVSTWMQCNAYEGIVFQTLSDQTSVQKKSARNSEYKQEHVHEFFVKIFGTQNVKSICSRLA